MVLEQYNKFKSVPNISYDAMFLVANESGVFLHSLGSFFINKLKELKTFLTGEMTSFNAKEDPYIDDLLAVYNKNKKKLASLEFMSIANTTIPWSEVLCKNLYDTSLSLKELYNEMNKVAINNLDSTETLLTKAVGQKDFIRTTTPIIIDSKAAIDSLAKCDSIFNKIIDPNFKKDKILLKEAIPNLSSIDNIIENLKSIKEMGFYEKHSLIEKMIKNIKEKTDNLELMLKQLKPNEISKPIIATIANELETTARVISCLGTVLALTSQSTRALQSIITEITK